MTNAPARYLFWQHIDDDVRAGHVELRSASPPFDAIVAGDDLYAARMSGDGGHTFERCRLS